MKRALLIGLASASLLASGWYIVGHIRAAAFNHCLIVTDIDPLFAPAIQDDLEHLCRTTFDAKKLTSWLARMLHHQPLIARICCTKGDYGAVYIAITSKSLRFMVNQNTLIDIKGHSYASNLIDDQYQEQLPQVQISEASVLRSQTFITFAQMVPDWLLHAYRIQWHSQFDVTITDSTNIQLRIRADQLPSARLISIAQHLIRHATNKPEKLYADLRFKGQIIIARQDRVKGGEGDGKSF